MCVLARGWMDGHVSRKRHLNISPNFPIFDAK
jgi:hypothetical protein